MDLNGPFGWRTLAPSVLDKTLEKLRQLERMTWSEILRTGKKFHHSVDVASLAPGAQKRLQELDLDDQDSLVSLRLDGVTRVWVMRNEHVAFLLWWDPEHGVCLSNKKHT